MPPAVEVAARWRDRMVSRAGVTASRRTVMGVEGPYSQSRLRDTSGNVEDRPAMGRAWRERSRRLHQHRHEPKATRRVLSERGELKCLSTVLDGHRDKHPWPVAAFRLLTLTGAQISEVLNLRWDEIATLSADDGTAACLPDTKTGLRTVWIGPEAARLLAALPRPEGRERVFPDDLTSSRLYTYWTGVREEADLPSVRIHDLRDTWASQGVMNGVGLPTVGPCSATSAGPPPPSTPTSTMLPCKTPPPRPLTSLPMPWGSRPGCRR